MHGKVQFLILFGLQYIIHNDYCLMNHLVITQLYNPCHIGKCIHHSDEKIIQHSCFIEYLLLILVFGLNKFLCVKHCKFQKNPNPSAVGSVAVVCSFRFLIIGYFYL